MKLSLGYLNSQVFPREKRILEKENILQNFYVVKIASNQRQVISSLLQSEASSGFLIQYPHGFCN